MTARMPSWLPASARTDLALLKADLKPAARLWVNVPLVEVRRWARRNGFFLSGDRDGFVVLSRQPAIARRVLELDRRPGKHTAALGKMLGYPVCCTRAAARGGDEGIDHRHDVIAARRFHGLFALINPKDYLEGRGLLSHVPCTHNCAASLVLALRTPMC